MKFISVLYVIFRPGMALSFKVRAVEIVNLYHRAQGSFQRRCTLAVMSQHLASVPEPKLFFMSQ